MSENEPKRTRLSPEARHEQLVGVAVDLLLSRPLAELSVEAVAAEAGVSRALIFHYFPTVRELRLAALRVAADSLVERLVDAVTAVGDRATRLSTGLDAFVGFIEQQPQTFDALSVMAASDEEFGAVFQAVRDQAATLVKEGVDGETNRLTDVLISGWVTFVETVVRSWVADPAGIERDVLISALLDGSTALIGPIDW